VGLVHRFSRARLARQVIRRLRRAGVPGARYDARCFQVSFTVDGDDMPTILELAPLLTVRGQGRRRQVDSFVAGLVRTPDLPADWALVRPMLRPVLRGGTPSAPLRRPFLPYLSEFVVVDQPDTMTYVAPGQPGAWGVSAEEVFAAARANLSGAVLQGVAKEPVVVRFVDDGDAYWTSHLLLAHWLERLAEQVGGVPVAFAPERGTLLVTADGSSHLPGLFAQAEEIYASSSRAITPMAYVSDQNGCTVPYQAPAGHPMHRAVQRAERVLAVQEYTRQATQHTSTAIVEALAPRRKAPRRAARRTQRRTRRETQREAGNGAQRETTSATRRRTGPETGDGPRPEVEPGTRPGSMAELRLIGSDEAGWRTQAVWDRDEPVLLPTADEVLIGSDVRPWDELVRHFTAEHDYEPLRWYAKHWPR
jgi:hypothetical protein